jgi:hypothetical protein|tara:strand:+ start:145 stop:525 length:381 start_codon:yes stop_codon:yes gene_type:complete
MTKLVENKIPLSFRGIASKRVLFRLVNPKRNKSKSFNIYEKARLSETIKQAFDNDYRKIDIDYDTTANNRFKKANVLVDVPQYIVKSKKKSYEEMLSSNREFIKDNKVPQSILDNQKYFENIVSNL